MANRKPDKQIFSSDLIYQTINAVSLYSEQTQYYHSEENRTSEPNKKKSEPGRGTNKYELEDKITKHFNLPFRLSDFFLMQRRWGNCTGIPTTPWFNYSYYSETAFNNIQAENIIAGFNDPENYPWDLLINHIEKHYQLNAVEDAKNWLIKIREDKPQVTNKLESELHHHLLQLYSHFPTRNYIHGGLYKNYIWDDLRSNNKIKRKGFYVFIDKDETKKTYPPYRVWEIEVIEGKVNVSGDGILHYQDEDSDDNERRVVQFFTEYVLPLFNFPNLDGVRRESSTTFEDAPFDHMLFLPLYDEYADGEFHGFFRGWLFQVFELHKDKLKELLEKKELDEEELEKRKKNSRTPLFGGKKIPNLEDPFYGYIKDCLSRTNYLTSELMRGVLREVLNQRISDKQTFSLLESSLCLIGDWKTSVTREITDKSNEFIKTSANVDGVNLLINLDPDFLEKDSEAFTTFEDLNENIKKNQELLLKFGEDFKPPSEDRKKKYSDEKDGNFYPKEDPYYLRLGNNIYTIFARLKNAKWAEIQSQKEGQIVEAKSQVSKWSHALQTKLALLEEIFNRQDELILSKEKDNLKGSLSSLRKTITALSYYQRVKDFLNNNNVNLLELKDNQHFRVRGFEEDRRNLGNILLEAFYLMSAKIQLRSGRFAEVKERLKSFYDSTSEIKHLPKLQMGLTESYVSEDDLRTIFPKDGTVSLQITPPEILEYMGTWKTITIPVNINESIEFYFDLTVGVIIDEILSNACKYVSKPQVGDAAIEIRLTLEDTLGLPQKWVKFEVLNTRDFSEVAHNLNAERDLLDYFSKSSGLGLFFNKELSETLIGDYRKDVYLFNATEDYSRAHAVFRFPVEDI